MKNNIYCPWLWKTAYIKPNGDVYNCCHEKPGILGNIYNQTLFAIWANSPNLKKFRQLSLKGCLSCFSNCNLLSKDEKASICPNPVVTKYPNKLIIRYGTACNLKCIMCRQDHLSKITLDNRVLKKNISWQNIENIIFTGGEILAINNAKKLYLWLTRQMNKKVSLLTNGILLDNQWREHLLRGAKWIMISVNAATKKTGEFVNKGTNYEKLIDNIKKLILLKRQYSLDVKIIYKFTIVPENMHEIADAIVFAKELGCDKISYSYDEFVPFVLEKHKQAKERIKGELLRVIKGNPRIEIDRNRLEYLNLLEK